MTALDFVAEMSNLLDIWEIENLRERDGDPLPTMIFVAEIIEKATEAYLKQDPDPFDDRHPSRAHPDCSLGHVLKKIFRHENFINTLLNSYIVSRNNSDLCTVACRILLDLLPGLDPAVFSDTEGLVNRLIAWAKDAPNPLQSYAVGLLSTAMEIQDVAASFREQNVYLVPLMLERLHELSLQYFKDTSVISSSVDIPFVNLIEDSQDLCVREMMPGCATNRASDTDDFKRMTASVPSFVCRTRVPSMGDLSNSSWTEMDPLMIGSYQVYPLTLANQQRYILQYLTSVGEYHELLTYVFEKPKSVIELVLQYINLKENSAVRLAFDALKYIASLLCHKKCAMKFISQGGVQRVLQVHRPSLAATGVSFVLYYLAYSEDAMQKVCLLPHHVLSDLVRYALWLLECSHDSGRCHATMFFGFTFTFKVIRGLFDDQDGLRMLFNVMSTLDIFVRTDSLSADQVFGSRQTARHVCVALKRYFEAHLASKAEELMQSQENFGSSYYNNREVEENIETLVEIMSPHASWDPVDEFVKLDGISFLMKLIALHFDWSYSGRMETVRSALDVLNVCSVTAKAQLALCANINVFERQNTVGISILLQAALGEVFADVDIRRSALNIIINCVIGPPKEVGSIIGRHAATKRRASRSSDDCLSKMWNCVRSNDGIMILLSLLTVKTPIADADSIRALACKALCGLARCDMVKQIVSKLPLFTNGLLQVLMREPVLQDKRQEHAKFVKHGVELIKRITGTKKTSGMASSISNINKAEIVAQTVIKYNEKQLLQLIAQHLMQKGLAKSSRALQEEAMLETIVPRTNLFSNLLEGSHPKLKRELSQAQVLTPTKANGLEPRLNENSPGHISKFPGAFSGFSSLSSTFPSCSNSAIQREDPSDVSVSGTVSLSSTNSGPIRVVHTSKNDQNLKTKKVRSSLQKVPICSGTYIQSPVMRKQIGAIQPTQSIRLSQNTPSTLDSIVAEYLRNQHALCKSPYVTCPTFDLYTPHQCPEPLYRNLAPINLALRMRRRESCPEYWGYSGARMNRVFLNTRFRDIRSCQDSDGNSLMSCAFSTFEENILAGTLTGELKVFSMSSGDEIFSFNCHESEVSNIQPAKNSDLLLTSASWRRPVSALWKPSNQFELLHTFPEECYMEFSKLNQDRIIGTKYEKARVYDTATCRIIKTLMDPHLGNNYTSNRATFNPTDELVLSDGVIWDLRASGKPVHKLDKFNPSINGVFHPNGLEIISNSEIWDLRTYRLLRTVSALEQCKIVFDSTGDIIYGAILTPEIENDDDPVCKRYGSSFRTFNAVDYSCIATKDIQRDIYDLAINSTDRYLAVIQNRLVDDGLGTRESICHVYEIGRSREDDDEEGREDDDDDDDDSRDMTHETEDDEEDDDDDDDDDDEEENDNGEEGNLHDNGPGEEMEEEEEEIIGASSSDIVSDEEYYFSFSTS